MVQRARINAVCFSLFLQYILIAIVFEIAKFALNVIGKVLFLFSINLFEPCSSTG